MPRYKIINDVKVQFSAAEETARDAEETRNVNLIQLEKNAEADVINKKASGKQKLLDLGLSEDEVKAMIGI
tara:strand:- start:44 stop:256 length:213 start_codon:yes stop_codon:yes gene_type:complete